MSFLTTAFAINADFDFINARKYIYFIESTIILGPDDMSRAGPVSRDDFQPDITWGKPARARTKFSINGFGWKLLFQNGAKRRMYKWRIFFSILNHLLQAYVALRTFLSFK